LSTVDTPPQPPLEHQARFLYPPPLTQT